MTLRLSLGCSRDDTTAGLFSGRASIAGVTLDLSAVPPAEVFARQRRGAEFDISEMSLSGHIMHTATGFDDFVGIPVFLNRVFRHSFVFVNSDAGIESPQDLTGRTVAVPEFHMTAALYVRGFLSDEYGVRASDINWVQAGRVDAGREERETLDLPESISLRIERERSLEQMLEAGEVDAAISTALPRSFGTPGSRIRRLFPNPKKEEAAYYERTGIFPIMHLVVIRRTLHEQFPWLAMNVTMGFLRSKKDYYARLRGSDRHHMSAIPFFHHYADETMRLFGADFCPYGLEENRHVLEAATRWSYEQGLSPRKVELPELFAETTLAEIPRD